VPGCSTSSFLNEAVANLIVKQVLASQANRHFRHHRAEGVGVSKAANSCCAKACSKLRWADQLASRYALSTRRPDIPTVERHPIRRVPFRLRGGTSGPVYRDDAVNPEHIYGFSVGTPFAYGAAPWGGENNG